MNSSVKTVGAYEAKTHLASLLKQVEKGKEFIITKRERPVARLVPIVAAQPDRREVFQRIRDLRGTLVLPEGETIKDLINAGRRMWSPLVFDASAAMGFLLEDEKAATSLKALKAMEQGAIAYVPTHWWIETANALLMAERRQRISQAKLTESIRALEALPVITDDETAKHCSGETLALARQCALTCYDAAYLELAMRRHAILVTIDRALAGAAKKRGVSVLG